MIVLYFQELMTSSRYTTDEESFLQTDEESYIRTDDEEGGNTDWEESTRRWVNRWTLLPPQHVQT